MTLTPTSTLTLALTRTKTLASTLTQEYEMSGYCANIGAFNPNPNPDPTPASHTNQVAHSDVLTVAPPSQ